MCSSDLARQYENAEVLFQRVIKDNPNDLEAHMKLGIIYTETDQFAKAVAEFKIVAEKGEGRYGKQAEAALYSLDNARADSLAREMKFDEALVAFKEITKYYPDSLEAHSKLGFIYRRLGRWDEARAEYEEVIRIDPENRKDLFNLGTVYEVMGLLERSEEHTSELQSH